MATAKEWVPKYLQDTELKAPGEIVTSKDWNDHFTLIRTQTNHISKTLDDLINSGNIKVQHSYVSDNSKLLDGNPSSYYAARQNVLGLDEQLFRPGSSWAPTFREQPSPKGYVDDLFEEYTVKYANGVTIFGIYPDLTSLLQEHPTGKIGESYVVGYNLYTWDPKTNRWMDLGPIRGPQGEKGNSGEGVPAGGFAKQMLVKKSAKDYDVEWTTFNADLDNFIKTTTVPSVDVGATPPARPQNGAIWFKPI